MSTRTLDAPPSAETEHDDDELVEPEGEPEPDAADEEAEGEESEAEPEPEPAAPAPPSSETIMRALEKEHTRHAKALRRIMGEGFDGYDDCPVCLSMGYVFGSPLVPDDETELCAKCKGFGVVRTASLVEHAQTRQCMTCLGNGYVTKTPDPVVAAPVPGNYPAVSTSASLPDPEIDRLRAQGYTVLPPYVAPSSPTP